MTFPDTTFVNNQTVIYADWLNAVNDICATATGENAGFQVDRFSGNGTTVHFTLTHNAPSEDYLFVFINGVYQEKNTYSYNAGTQIITFSVAPPIGTDNIEIVSASTFVLSSADASTVTYEPPFANSVATTVQNKLAQTVSVKDFGAVGDGVTDDTIAIQNAIDAVYSAGGGDVLFPTGVYIVSATIEVPQRVYLVGSGWGYVNPYISGDVAPNGTVLFLKTGSNVDVVRIRCRLTNTSGVLTDTGLGTLNQNARHGGGISNLLVWGNRSTDQLPTVKDLNTVGKGIAVQGCRTVNVLNCCTMFCAESGFHVTSFNYGTGALTTNNMFVQNLTSRQNALKGFEYYGGDCNFSQLNCGYNGTDGVLIGGSCSLVGGTYWNNMRSGIVVYGIVAAGSAQITGTYCYDNDSAGYSIGNCFDVQLTGCIGRGNGANTSISSTLRTNFYVRNDASGVQLVGCKSYAKYQDYTDVTQYGFYINNTTHDVVIDGCSDEAAVVSAFAVNRPSALYLHGNMENAYKHPPLRLSELPVTPTAPEDRTECNVYMKSDKIIFAYNDAGTIRYKYLDLSGTGVTWVQTTTAP